MASQNPWSDDYLTLYAVEELVERNHGYGVSEFMPRLLLIGSDGGSEGIGLDMRGQDSPVVMVELSSLRWEEAIQQAESFDEFIETCSQGRPLRWEAI